MAGEADDVDASLKMRSRGRLRRDECLAVRKLGMPDRVSHGEVNNISERARRLSWRAVPPETTPEFRRPSRVDEDEPVTDYSKSGYFYRGRSRWQAKDRIENASRVPYTGTYRSITMREYDCLSRGKPRRLLEHARTISWKLVLWTSRTA